MSRTQHRLSQHLDRPWFIHDQTWSLLEYSGDEETKRCLNPQAMRPGNKLSDAILDEFASHWLATDRHEVALNRSEEGRNLDFERIVVTSEAGVGKSQSLGWLEYRINQSDSHAIAFRFDLRQAVANYGLKSLEVEAGMYRAMAKIWHNKTKDGRGLELPIPQAELYLRGLARQGQLCLIFDGLDQSSTKDVAILSELLQAPDFRRSRFVLAGRPHALLTNWEALFASSISQPVWRFIKVEEFTRAQQVRYLGWLSDGKLRFTEIPRESRSILTVPRVLSYLRRENDLRRFRHAADVYLSAIKNILREGMSRSRKAAMIGLSSPNELVPRAEGGYQIDGDQVAAALELLCITAFYSLIHHHQPPTWATSPSGPEVEGKPFAYPYVHNVVKKGQFREVRKQIKLRSHQCNIDGKFKNHWNGIAALNSQFLEQGLFEDSTGSLDQIVWANRSLHEFLLAYFFSQLATPADCERLWDWIYLKDQSPTEDYYQFWQFLCEMPEDARDDEKWLSAIEMLYQPAVRVAPDNSEDEPTYFAKRSSEMIYRSWWKLDEYCQEENPRAIGIREKWWGEFEKIWKKGAHGPVHQQTANDIVEHLLDLPGGTFRMGTTPEKQGFQSLPLEQQQYWIRTFADFRSNPVDAIGKWFSQLPQTRASDAFRERCESRWTRLARSSDEREAFSEFINDVYPANEQELVRAVSNFQLGRQTLTNRFVRLFDPTHGLRQSDLWKNYAAYATYSATSDHPANFLNWFDGWVICQWLRWNGQSCQLPYEDQWEFAVKLGLNNEDWHWRYWWGDDFELERDRQRINCSESKHGKPLVACADRASPGSRVIDSVRHLGLSDLLGNLMQWCQDASSDLQASYERNGSELLRDATTSRSVRGGSFFSFVVDSRCSFRDFVGPYVAGFMVGVRVARARR